jgi:ribosome-associated protein
LAAELALEKKAEDIVILDMRRVCNFCDYFVILDASSKRRAKAISENIQKGLEKKGLKFFSCEGEITSEWILLDYRDVIVHIFYKPYREFYDLERIWPDAERIIYNQNGFRRENFRISEEDNK